MLFMFFKTEISLKECAELQKESKRKKGKRKMEQRDRKAIGKR
jgi:hypothetical protein